MALTSDQVVGFRPLHKAHAIEQVAIVVAVDKEIDDKSLAQARDAIAKPDDLPVYNEMSGVSFSFGNNMVVPVPTAPTIAGHSFTKKAEDGAIESELTLQRAAIGFRTNLYTRWAHVRDQGRKHFEQLLPIYAQAARITQVSLSYVDKFLWDGPAGKYDTSSVLAKNSRFLAPDVLQAPDLWHCHTGKFMPADEFTKRLIQVNVDYLDALHQGESKRTISIRTVLVDMFNQHSYQVREIGADNAGQIVHGQLESMHDMGKTILKSIITPDMARRIAL